METILKAIIFDMDGVLINSMQYHVQSWKEAFAKVNIYPSNQELLLLEGVPYKQTIDIISQKVGIVLSDRQKEDIHEAKKTIMQSIFTTNVDTSIKEFLMYAKQKSISLAVVTGSHKQFAYTVIEKYFKECFNVVITGEDVEHGKPSPEPYLKAIEKLALEPQKTLVIENAPLGIESAKKAGLTVYAVETTLNRKYLKEADRVFKDHKKIFSFLNKSLR